MHSLVRMVARPEPVAFPMAMNGWGYPHGCGRYNHRVRQASGRQAISTSPSNIFSSQMFLNQQSASPICSRITANRSCSSFQTNGMKPYETEETDDMLCPLSTRGTCYLSRTASPVNSLNFWSKFALLQHQCCFYGCLASPRRGRGTSKDCVLCFLDVNQPSPGV